MPACKQECIIYICKKYEKTSGYQLKPKLIQIK